MADAQHSFYSRLAGIFNSEQARSVILCGHVYDLFLHDRQYKPLIPFLCDKFATDGLIRLVYELNGPVRILDDREKLKNAWISWKAGVDLDTLVIQGMRNREQTELQRLGDEFERLLLEAIGNPNLALELLRQLTICSRCSPLRGNLMILVEAADMLLPVGRGDVASLSDKQLHRISIVQDWFSDPGFMSGGDSVCLVAESRSLIHPRVSRLPQVLEVEVSSPDTSQRLAFIEDFCQTLQPPPKLWGTTSDLAALTAGLSMHAIRQLLLEAAYTHETLTPKHLVAKVADFIQSQVGEDVVEFKKPTHRLQDVVGNTRLKQFIQSELLPRFRASGDKALSGAGVAGPIGGGKTFIFEAVAGELGVPVLVLKSIRSQWFGQTDVIFERLRRVLLALEKVVIFVDEADTQFGGVGQETHSTERRLTGKIQAMMSDPALRGKVTWLLMTARIHLLSPDIRRPGRVGDLIIPVLDAQGEDRIQFLRWMLRGILHEPSDEDIQRLDQLTPGYSAAAFASLRSQLKACQVNSFDDVARIISDHIPPAIGKTRRYQTLQALINCTRRSLLPDPKISDQQREAWQLEAQKLEALGIR